MIDVDREAAERAFLEFRGQIRRVGEITDVAHRSDHLVLIAEVPADSLRLGRRLDDHELLGRHRSPSDK